MDLTKLPESVSAHWASLEQYHVSATVDWLLPSLTQLENLHHLDWLLLTDESNRSVSEITRFFSDKLEDFCSQSRAIVACATGKSLTQAEIEIIKKEMASIRVEILIRLRASELFCSACLLVVKCKKLAKLWAEVSLEPTMTTEFHDAAALRRKMFSLSHLVDELKSKMAKFARFAGIVYQEEQPIEADDTEFDLSLKMLKMNIFENQISLVEGEFLKAKDAIRYAKAIVNGKELVLINPPDPMHSFNAIVNLCQYAGLLVPLVYSFLTIRSVFTSFKWFVFSFVGCFFVRNAATALASLATTEDGKRVDQLRNTFIATFTELDAIQLVFRDIRATATQLQACITMANSTAEENFEMINGDDSIE